MKRIITFNKFINESVKDFLKPKSEKEIKKSLDKLEGEKKLNYIIKYDLADLVTDEELKKTVNSLNTMEEMVYYIARLELNHLFSKKEMRYIESMFRNNVDKRFNTMEEKIDYIIEFDELQFYSMKDIKDMVDKLSTQQRIEVIMNKHRDFLLGVVYSNDDIKDMIKTFEPDQQLIYIIQYQTILNMYTDDDIKDIVNKLSSSYEKLSTIFNTNLRIREAFDDTDIITIFNKLSYHQKIDAIDDWVDLQSILPVEILIKYH